MNPDLWWSCHRSVKRASDSSCSNVLSWIQATIWTHFIMAHPDNSAACPGTSVSAFHPLEATLHATATRILFQSESYPMALMTHPQWPPSFLRVKFWFLQFYTCLHDLSPGPLCLIPSTPLPLNPLSLSHSGHGCCSNIQTLFWKHLPKTSLSQSISLTLASLLYPHLSLSSQCSS